MSIRVSLRGMLRLIRVDTLRRVHSVTISRDGSYTDLQKVIETSDDYLANSAESDQVVRSGCQIKLSDHRLSDQVVRSGCQIRLSD